MTARRCQSKTQAGAPCRALALSDGPFCLGHDPRPEKRELLTNAARKGGLVRQWVNNLETPEIKGSVDVFRVLVRAIQELRAGELQPGVAFTLNALCNSALTALKAIRELEPVEEGKKIPDVRIRWPWEGAGGPVVVVDRAEVAEPEPDPVAEEIRRRLVGVPNA